MSCSPSNILKHPLQMQPTDIVIGYVVLTLPDSLQLTVHFKRIEASRNSSVPVVLKKKRKQKNVTLYLPQRRTSGARAAPKNLQLPTCLRWFSRWNRWELMVGSNRTSRRNDRRPRDITCQQVFPRRPIRRLDKQ